MSERNKVYVLIILLAIAAVVYLRARSDVPGFQGVLASNTKFTPLDVQQPDLRLDLLAKIHKSEYTGMHRDIFNGAPMPTPAEKEKFVEQNRGATLPQRPPPPPPVQVPAQFFGFATRAGNKKVAFFLNGEDVLVVAEGDTFLGNFRLVHIGNESADVQELSTGRHATVNLEHRPDEAVNQNP